MLHAGIKLYYFQHLNSYLAIFLADNMLFKLPNKIGSQLTFVRLGLNKYFLLLHPSSCLYGNYCLCLHLLLMHTHFLRLPTLVFNLPVHMHTHTKEICFKDKMDAESEVS